MILLSVFVVILVYAVIVAPVTDRHTIIVEEVEMKSKTLGKYKLLLNTAAETRDGLKGVAGELDTYEGLLIDVENDAMGFARLNSYMQELINKSGVEVISIKPLNVVKYDLHVGLPIQVNATADTRQVITFLQSLSSGKYLVSIDNVNIRVVNTRKPDKLRIKIQISGYREI